MMKYQVMFAVWALLAAHVSCAAVEPVELQYSDGTELANSDEGPVQIIESFEEVNLDSDFSGAIGRNSLIFRETFRHSEVVNTVLVHVVKYTGWASTVISSVQSKQIGYDEGAMVVITDGGVGSNTVTLEIRSVRGRGFHVQIELYGRL